MPLRTWTSTPRPERRVRARRAARRAGGRALGAPAIACVLVGVLTAPAGVRAAQSDCAPAHPTRHCRVRLIVEAASGSYSARSHATWRFSTFSCQADATTRGTFTWARRRGDGGILSFRRGATPRLDIHRRVSSSVAGTDSCGVRPPPGGGSPGTSTCHDPLRLVRTPVGGGLRVVGDHARLFWDFYVVDAKVALCDPAGVIDLSRNHLTSRLPIRKLLEGQPVEAAVSLKLDYTTDRPPTDGYDDFHETITGSGRFSATLRKAGPEAVIVARPAGARPAAEGASGIERADRVVIDGSRSKGRITSYRWRFAPGRGCPPGAGLSADSAKGRQVRFRMLCALRVTLTVTDRHGVEARQTKVVSVAPREWVTKPEYEEDDTSAQPRLPTAGASIPEGENACPDGQAPGAFCVFVGEYGRHYNVATVDDDGPFKGYRYVDSTDIGLHRVGFINPAITPNGPAPAPGAPNFYAANAQGPLAGTCCDARWFLQWARGHEGYGQSAGGTGAVAASGHMQLLVAGITDHERHNDPRLYLEGRIDPPGTARGAFERGLNRCLFELDKAVDRYADDPLAPPQPRVFNMRVWDGAGYRTEAFAYPAAAPDRRLDLPACADRR